MRLRIRKSVYTFGVFSLFVTALLFMYQNFGTYYVEIQTNSDQLQPQGLDIGLQDNLLNMVPKLPSQKMPSGFHSQESELWPDLTKPWDDRILKQMHFVPSTYRETDDILEILRPGGMGSDPIGQQMFLDEECPVNRCSLTSDLSRRMQVNAVVYQNDYITYTPVRGPTQIWILWILESPLNSFVLTPLANQVNWTATYRMDSTIVAPYAKFMHFDNFTGQLKTPKRDYLQGKTKAVAWFVSNCNSDNRRFQYGIELQKYIQVDIYGACGTLECPRYKEKQCFHKLSREYMFYLSFENSNCQYYITEKFFLNALENDIVPVVLGGRKQDYLAAAPPESFIHIEDFDGPQELAEYLQKLSETPELYNQYFRWKGTGHFINTKFWCRVCAMLHSVVGSGLKSHDRGSGTVVKRRWYPDLERWWRNNQTCTRGIWRDPKAYYDGHDWREILGVV